MYLVLDPTCRKSSLSNKVEARKGGSSPSRLILFAHEHGHDIDDGLSRYLHSDANGMVDIL